MDAVVVVVVVAPIWYYCVFFPVRLSSFLALFFVCVRRVGRGVCVYTPEKGQFGALAAARRTDAIGENTVAAVEVNSARSRRVRASGKRVVCVVVAGLLRLKAPQHKQKQTNQTPNTAATRGSTSQQQQHPRPTKNRKSLRFICFFLSVLFCFRIFFFLRFFLFILVVSCVQSRTFLA